MATIKQNFFYNTVLNVLKVIFPVITAPYIARVLAPEGVGLFNFANMYASYFAMVAVLGIPTYGTREVAKARDDKDALQKIFSEMFTIVCITTAVVTIFYLLSIAFVPKLHENHIVFLIIGTLLYFAPFGIDWYYAGLEEFKYITMRSVLIKTLSVAALFVFVRHRGDLVIYVVICVLANLANTVWNYVKLLKSGIRPRLVRTGLGRHWKPVMILFASAAAVSVYTLLDTVMLGFMKDNAEVAFYSNAANISRTIIAALTSFSAVAIPRMSIYLKENDTAKINEISGKSFSLISFLAIPAAVGLACIAPVFAPLFYGDMYYACIVPLQIMSFVIIAIGLNNLSGVQVLVGLGRDSMYLTCVVAGALVNITLNLVLIPRMGARGAALSSVAAEMLILALTTFCVYRYTFVRPVCISDLAKSCAASLVFIPLLFLLGRFLEGWWLVGVFVVTGFVLYVTIQYIARNGAIMLFFSALSEFLEKHGLKGEASAG